MDLLPAPGTAICVSLSQITHISMSLGLVVDLLASACIHRGGSSTYICTFGRGIERVSGKAAVTTRKL